MEALPSYVKVLYSSRRRSFDPSVLKADMERGPTKYRLANSQVLMKQAMTFYFFDLTDAEAFEDWYFDDLKRIGKFTMVHPDNGRTITCNFTDGSIGELVPGEALDCDYQRDVVVEYLR